ncbi:MAG: Holliday junction resolvase RuvX [bacterium]|nr:Holliday junction resolvase RuvX [bacterium]
MSQQTRPASNGMSRILGLDYGMRRIGIALSDERGMMGFPYGVLDTKEMEEKEIFEYFESLCKKESVGDIVLGIPRGLSEMQETEMTDRTFTFGKKLKKFDIPVHFIDEFLSTKEAKHGPTTKENIDASAATIILQSFIDSRKQFVLE